MKNRILKIALAVVALLVSGRALAWENIGHAVIAYNAERLLDPEVKAKCRHYLKATIPFYATWMDQARSIEPYTVCDKWHSTNIDAKNKVVVGLPTTGAYHIERIRKEMAGGAYKNMSDSLVAVNLKLLIHMVGDMHCPSHIVYTKDFGMPGYSIKVKGKKVGRHSFWDRSPQYMHPKWKADRFVKAYDTYTPKEIKKICKGDAYKWSVQNANNILKTGNYWERGAEFTKLSKEQRKQIDETLHEQLAFAGYRLASTLNKIFSK